MNSILQLNLHMRYLCDSFVAFVLMSPETIQSLRGGWCILSLFSIFVPILVENFSDAMGGNCLA